MHLLPFSTWFQCSNIGTMWKGKIPKYGNAKMGKLMKGTNKLKEHMEM